MGACLCLPKENSIVAPADAPTLEAAITPKTALVRAGPAGRARSRDELWACYHAPSPMKFITAWVSKLTPIEALSSFGMQRTDIINFRAAGVTMAALFLRATERNLAVLVTHERLSAAMTVIKRQLYLRKLAVAMATTARERLAATQRHDPLDPFHVLPNAFHVLPEELLQLVMSYCRTGPLAALSAACKWLRALTQAELRRHRDGVAIVLDDVQPAITWDWQSLQYDNLGAAAVMATGGAISCGLFVKRPSLINNYESYHLAGHPRVMLWKCSSAHWIVGLKDAHGANKDACYMQGDRDLVSGRCYWQVAQWDPRQAWTFVGTFMQVVISNSGENQHAMRVVNRYNDARHPFLARRQANTVLLNVKVVDLEQDDW